MPNLKGMNIEALMKLRNQVDERHLGVAIGVGVAIALTIIGYLLQWISSSWGFRNIVAHQGTLGPEEEQSPDGWLRP